MWNGIKEIIFIKKTSKIQPKCLKVDSNLINDGKEVVDEFSNYFGTIAKIIDKKTPRSKKQFSDYLRNSNINSLLLNPVTEKEISEIINKISNGKAAGPNSVPNDILEEYKDILKVPLTIIINISFMTGRFPKQCEIAHITPVYKKGDKLDTSNYRPISLLSNISKIIEKIMYSRLYKFPDKYNCLYKKQFGFEIPIRLIML